MPLTLVAGNLLLAPFEARMQRRYWDEAHEALRRVDPMVIAITGSYGKTSVKHILGHVLETAAPTLITPGSVNTAMGIARVVRERLQPHHRYFVVEMGAYGIGLDPPAVRADAAETRPRHRHRQGALRAVQVAGNRSGGQVRARRGGARMAERSSLPPNAANSPGRAIRPAHRDTTHSR